MPRSRDVDLIVIPGGFSYGDYLQGRRHRRPLPDHGRPSAPKQRAGVRVLGVCNGFQILTEAQLLPGVLMRNASLRFVCRDVTLSVDERRDPLHRAATRPGQVIRTPGGAP
jgi:phosphoribosylformylglycinamidine (FGAM) synthase-like amidotransferase family enzyme